MMQQIAAVKDKVNKDHDLRIASLEAELKGLKDSLAGIGQSSSKESNLDSNQIMLRINMLQADIKNKIDITVINSQMEDNKNNFAEQLQAMTKRVQKTETA